MNVVILVTALGVYHRLVVTPPEAFRGPRLGGEVPPPRDPPPTLNCNFKKKSFRHPTLAPISGTFLLVFL